MGRVLVLVAYLAIVFFLLFASPTAAGQKQTVVPTAPPPAKKVVPCELMTVFYDWIMRQPPRMGDPYRMIPDHQLRHSSRTRNVA